MLDEKDKEWILGAISGAILQTVPGIVDERLERGLTKGFEAQKAWFSNELKIQLNDGLDKLRVELTEVMQDGFSECASAKQVVELGGSLDRLTGNVEQLTGNVERLTVDVNQLTGYVEEVREMVAGGFTECASAKQLDDLRDAVGDGFFECASARQVERVEKKVDKVEANMVSKTEFNQHATNEYATHKKQSTKFTALVEVLRQEKLLSTRRANVVLAMEPHPVKLKE